MNVPIFDPHDFPYEYNEKIFEEMSRYFVPVETSELYKKVRKNDKILCSLIVDGEYIQNTKYYFKKWTWKSHVLLTKLGFAYRNHSNNERFYYWNIAKPKAVLGKHKKYKVIVDGETLDAGTPSLSLFPLTVNIGIRKYFSDFCILLYKNYLGYLKEMKECTKNIELLKNKLEQLGVEGFIEDCRTFKLSNFSKQALKIAQSMENLVDELQLYKTLHFQAECYFWKSHISKAIRIYDKILDVYPNDPDTLTLKDRAQQRLKK